MISKEIEIEDLVRDYPESVTYLRENGIRCLRCGEPVWGSLEEAAKEKNFSNEEINQVVNELNERFNGR